MRYCGVVGYRITVEKLDENGIGHGVWVPQIIERTYKGDVIKDYSRNSDGESINDDRLISNNISIVADKYSLSNFTSIIYCKWMGIKWKVTSIDSTSPHRLILTLGGVYNEGQDRTGRPAEDFL